MFRGESRTGVKDKGKFSPTQYEKSDRFMNTSCLKGRCMVTISKTTISVIAASLVAVFLLALSITRPSPVETATTAGEWDQMLETEEEEPLEPSLSEREEHEVMVDVKGAVKQPGVYVMKLGDRVTDAIQLAGGFHDDADQTQVNLAAKVKDELVIYVPKEGELPSTPFVAAIEQSDEGALVNINTASNEELQTLQGIGPAKAEAIIAYREEQGGFQKKEDLLNVSGIGEKSFEKIKEHITIQ